jgi:hypothetical protein
MDGPQGRGYKVGTEEPKFLTRVLEFIQPERP